MSATGFRNPVIPGFHPDPSVCRVGDTYYCIASSFTYFPGVPIFRSTNLVDWEQIGNVLDRPAQLDLLGCQASSSYGIYAPTLRHHDGRWYMITTLFGEAGLKNFFVTADAPEGPWSDPVWVDVMGIDPDIAWDDEGNCWVHYSIMSIQRARIDDRTGEVLAAPVATWSGTGLHAPEAPHLFHIGDWWYLLIAEGGTERGHCVSIARGPSPEGPWESCPHNPILSHRSTPSPIQNTGHADLVQAPDGSWWMVLLGVRATGRTPHFHVLGRETYLTSVEWAHGWPVVAQVQIDSPVRPPGAPTPLAESPRDEFEGDDLHPWWVTVRRPWGEFADLTTRPGALTLHGADASGGPTLDTTLPVYVGRRQQHHACRVAAPVDIANVAPGAEAGLAVLMDEGAHYRIAVEGDRIVARARVGALSAEIGAVRRPTGTVVLSIRTTRHEVGSDTVRLGHEDAAGEFHQVAEMDGRYLSTEVNTGFIGRTIGMFATGCDGIFDWFEYDEGEW
jgi:beta-xylosidase